MNTDKELEKVISEIANDYNLTETQKQELILKMGRLKNTKINILITGATGCGKSSTINALFGDNVAKVGQGATPETMDIVRYEHENNIILWDSPGLGDGKEADERHTKGIISKLKEKDEEGNALIDLVLVILDGGSRDLGTSYTLINEVIIPNLGDTKRLLVAINQCDMAMKGRNWNTEKNEPEQPLIDFLDEKVKDIQKRIKEATNVDITPIYYSAGYKDGDNEQLPYNLSKLLYFIVSHTKKEKRMVFQNRTNKNEKVWEKDDWYQRKSEEFQNEKKEEGGYKKEADKEVEKSLIERTVEVIEKYGPIIVKTVKPVVEKALPIIKKFFGF